MFVNKNVTVRLDGILFALRQALAVSRHSMTDDAIITSIRNSGGWCQLHHSNKTSLNDTLGGRLLFYNTELAYIEKFNIRADFLDGYLVVLNNTRQRFKKAQWIKKILTIAGKTIADPVFPESLNSNTVQELMQKLQSSREPLAIRLPDQVFQGRVADFSDTNLFIESLVNPSNGENCKIFYSDIICLELRTKDVKSIRTRTNGG